MKVYYPFKFPNLQFNMDFIRFCNRHMTMSYLFVTLFTIQFYYVANNKNVGNVSILILLSVWSFWNSILSIYCSIQLNDRLFKLNDITKKYSHNDVVYSIYHILAFSMMNIGSDFILAIIDAIYYSSIYEPILSLQIISVLKYTWHFCTILTTFLLFYNIRLNIKLSFEQPILL